jgi:hypothetical protein
VNSLRRLTTGGMYGNLSSRVLASITVAREPLIGLGSDRSGEIGSELGALARPINKPGGSVFQEILVLTD